MNAATPSAATRAGTVFTPARVPSLGCPPAAEHLRSAFPQGAVSPGALSDWLLAPSVPLRSGVDRRDRMPGVESGRTARRPDFTIAGGAA